MLQDSGSTLTRVYLSILWSPTLWQGQFFYLAILQRLLATCLESNETNTRYFKVQTALDLP
jgi:hypothetical protein